MSDIQKYDPSDPNGYWERIKRQMDQDDAADQKIRINIHYSEAAGSDPEIIMKIAEALASKLPFGLKCRRSRVVFIPTVLKAYWLWSDGEHGPVFQYRDMADLIGGVKMQYLTHKEFITTAELAAVAKIILYQNALDNVESWERKILPQPDEPSGSVVASNGRIRPDRSR